MDFGVAVDFRGGGLEDTGLEAARKTEHVDGSEDGGLDGLDGVVLIMWRRGRAGEIVDLIDLDAEGLGDVVPDELEVRVIHQVGDVLLAPGEEIVRADDFVVLLEQAFAEVGSEESGSASDKNAFFHGLDGVFRC